MDKDEALSFIHGCLRFGSVLGLDSIKRLMAKLDNVQEGMNYIHVAGTNGKGSVCSMLSAMLCAEGFKTGLYTSPALVHFNERIRINGEEISDNDLAGLTERVKAACREIEGEGFPHPTEFEVVTAIAFLYYKMQGCDYVVLETGMGGRLDATNVITSPRACVITSVSLDHTDRLGKTVTAIAKEKCGIIKKDAITVTYDRQDKDALAVIRDTATQLEIAKTPEIKSETIKGLTFDFGDMKDLFLSLTGEHQAENAACAIAAAKAVGLSEESIRSGLSHTVNPARLELVSENPTVILDGAHNPSAMLKLKASLSHLLNNGRKMLIIGMLRDKDYKACAEIIGTQFDRIITVTVDSQRTLPASDLAAEMRKYCKDVTAMELSDAVAEIKKEKTTVVAGSLYMVAEFKSKFTNR